MSQKRVSGSGEAARLGFAVAVETVALPIVVVSVAFGS